MSNDLNIITRKALLQMVPYTPQHILRLEKKGRFPKRIRIGENRVGWLLSEVQAWLQSRIAERNVPSKIEPCGWSSREAMCELL